MLVGGGVEDSDPSHEAALLREVREEIAGDAEIIAHLHDLTNHLGDVEHFYIARVTAWDFTGRTGPEFALVERGVYVLEKVPLTAQAIDALNLMPPLIKPVLLAAIESGTLPTAPA